MRFWMFGRWRGASLALSSSRRTPGPITTGLCCCAKAGEQRLSKHATRRMGPGVRRDDVWVGFHFQTATTALTSSLRAKRSNPALPPRTRKLDCFVASAPRNDGEIQLRDPAARCVRVLASLPPLEGVGNAGRRCTRSRACSVVNTRVSHHRSTGTSRHSRTQWFYGLFRALPGDRACLPPSLRNCFRQLDTSVGVSGPHDFAVRLHAVRQWHYRRPPHPVPRS